MPATQLEENSYAAHSQFYQEYEAGGLKTPLADTWMQNDSIDAWRHNRMYETLLPLLEDREASWLTVGDGRFGKDAQFIISHGGKALPTDLDGRLLHEAKEKGWINDYRIENAEKLSFQSTAFDYVLCKESFHHFPRPWIALYEMLRVARKAVILIEPSDPGIPPMGVRGLVYNIRFLVGKVIKRYKVTNNYWEAHNYVFGLSSREIEKVSLGLGLPFLAYKLMNDHYEKGMEYIKISDPKEYLLISRKIQKKNRLSYLGWRVHSYILCVLFNEKPRLDIQIGLRLRGFVTQELAGIKSS